MASQGTVGLTDSKAPFSSNLPRIGQIWCAYKVLLENCHAHLFTCNQGQNRKDVKVQVNIFVFVSHVVSVGT